MELPGDDCILIVVPDENAQTGFFPQINEFAVGKLDGIVWFAPIQNGFQVRCLDPAVFATFSRTNDRGQQRVPVQRRPDGVRESLTIELPLHSKLNHERHRMFRPIVDEHVVLERSHVQGKQPRFFYAWLWF